MPTTSSSRNQAADRSAAAGIPERTTRPPARVACSEVSSDCLLPTASTATSTPPKRYGEENSGWSLEGARGATYPPQHLARGHHLGRAELARELLLVAVLGDHDDLAGVGELAQRERGEEAHRPRAADQHPVAGA